MVNIHVLFAFKDPCNNVAMSNYVYRGSNTSAHVLLYLGKRDKCEAC